MPPGFRQGYSSDPYTSSLPTMVASTGMSRIAFLSTARGLSPVSYTHLTLPTTPYV